MKRSIFWLSLKFFSSLAKQRIFFIKHLLVVIHLNKATLTQFMKNNDILINHTFEGKHFLGKLQSCLDRTEFYILRKLEKILSSKNRLGTRLKFCLTDCTDDNSII